MNTAALNFRALPVSERIELAQDIWDSIAEETPNQLQLTPDEREVLHQRLSDHRANPSSSIPWDQVRALLFKSQH
ncbi:MAG: addiction module protein [Polaromonas sp.]